MKTFHYRGEKDSVFWTIGGLTLIFVSVFILMAMLFKTNSSRFNLIAWIVPVLFMGLGALILKVLIARYHLHKSQRDSRLTLDVTNCSFVIENPSKSTFVESSQVSIVEVHESWNTSPILSNLDFIRIRLINDVEIVISKLIASQFDLQPVLRGKTE
jgi:uncharacterized membrane protein YhdT